MERYRSGYNGTVLKTVVPSRVPWVRIPLSPPFFLSKNRKTRYPEQYSSWWRGAPAKGVGRLNPGARVRVSPAPPQKRPHLSAGQMWSFLELSVHFCTRSALSAWSDATHREVPAGVSGTLNFTLRLSRNTSLCRRHNFTWQSQTSLVVNN